MNRRHFLQTTGAALAAMSVGGGMAPAHAAALTATAFHDARRYASTPFGDIAYVERGHGLAALFLHGFPLNGFQWRGALERLAPYRRCIAPDFLALGYTRVRPGQAVDPDAQVAMLAAFLDHLELEHVDVVANDSGGAVAQLLLVRHPQRVRSLLLTNCDSEYDSPPPALLPVIELAKQGKFVDDWLGRWWQDPVRARSPAGIGGMCYAAPEHPDDEAIDMYFGPLLSTQRRKQLVHAYAIALERNALAGIGAQLRASRAPARIVWGMADRIFAARGADDLHVALGTSRGVRRLPESKLFWPEERPDVIAQEARALWQAWAANEVRR